MHWVIGAFAVFNVALVFGNAADGSATLATVNAAAGVICGVSAGFIFGVKRYLRS